MERVAEEMLVHTTRFGELDIQEEQIVQFANGLPGFEQVNRFVMIDLEPYRPFLFMQSIDFPEITFILLDPYKYFAEYPTAPQIAIEAKWPLEDEEQFFVRVIVTVYETGNMTANLIAPILLDIKKNIGEQVILQNVKGLLTQHPLVLDSGKQTEVEVGS